MTPEMERFLDLATRPLDAEPGMRDEAKGELMARVGHAGVPYEMLDLREPSERLEANPPKNPWPRRAALLAALVVSLATVATSVILQSREFTLMTTASMMSFNSRMARGPAPFVNPRPFVLQSAPDFPLGSVLLLGVEGEMEPGEWLERHPDDLAMFQEQVSRRLEITAPWTGLNEQETAMIARLDAGNALWPLIQIAPQMDAAIPDMDTYLYASALGGSPVSDETAFQNALRLFSEAATKSSYSDRSPSLKRRQLEAFRQSRTVAEDMFAAGFSKMVYPPFERYSDGFQCFASVQCERLVKAADKDGLRRFFGEWKQLVDLITNSAEPVDPENNGAISQLQRMEDPFADAFDKLGMPVEKAEVEERKKSLAGTRYSLSSAPPEIEAMAGLRVSAQSSLPRDLTVDQLRPSRKTEMAFFDRSMGSFLAVLGLIFTGLVGLETCRRSRIVKGMARGLKPLFRLGDHLWIAGLGLVFPWLWWWAFTRISPLGLRELKFDEWYVLVWVLQPIAGFIFGLVMLLQTARWRWGKQGGFLCLGGSLPWLGWIAAALAGLAIPASGVVRYFQLNDDETTIFLIGVFSMSACGLLWLLWEGIMTLFTPRSSALRPNLVMRALLPWCFAGVLTLMASVAVSTKMERIWFLKDPLLPT